MNDLVGGKSLNRVKMVSNQEPLSLDIKTGTANTPVK